MKDKKVTDYEKDFEDKKSFITDILGIVLVFIPFVVGGILLGYNFNLPSEVVEAETVKIEELKNLVVASNGTNAYINMFEAIKNSSEDANVTFSPYSLKLALLLALEGAEEGSECYEQMTSVLGIQDFTSNDTSQIYKSINKNSNINILNSIWYDNRLEGIENSEYFEQIKKLYDAEGYKYKLSSNEFVKSLNSYVSKNTNTLIPILLNEPLSDDARVCLLNVIYFKDKWLKSFEIENTWNDNFNGKTVNEVMHQRAYFDYVKDFKGFDIVRMPYETENFVMDVYIASNRDIDSYDLFKDLKEVDKQQLISLDDVKFISDNKVALSLPKFSTKTTTSFVETLKDLGMTSPFDMTSDSFPKIYKDLHIDEILQSAKVKCNEEGTEAAAATAIIMNDMMAAPADIEVIVPFEVDNPFIYVIRNTESNEILFMGYVSDINE